MLTEQQIRLYARQVILRELGPAGQARLCASRVAMASSDAGVDHRPAPALQVEVAREYLKRAGLNVVENEPGVPVVTFAEAPDAEPALQRCADWLLGAWAAVETIKRVTGVGTEAKHSPAPWTAEVD